MTDTLPLFPLSRSLFPDGRLPLQIFQVRDLDWMHNRGRWACGFQLLRARLKILHYAGFFYAGNALQFVEGKALLGAVVGDEVALHLPGTAARNFAITAMIKSSQS